MIRVYAEQYVTELGTVLGYGWVRCVCKTGCKKMGKYRSSHLNFSKIS